jgi:transposase
MEIIHLVERSNLSVKKTLEELQMPRSTLYSWYQRYQEHGMEGLKNKKLKVKLLKPSHPRTSLTIQPSE